MSFIVYSLPRSRSFWLSRYLSYRDWHCGHDEIRHVRSMDDVRSWFSQPCTGTVETAGAPWWRLVSRDVRTVVVRRPVAEVVGSLERQGFSPEMMHHLMARLDHKLDQIEARVPNVLSVRFADLAQEETCARVFEHCLPYEHDPKWWALMSPINLQDDLPAQVRYAVAYKPQMDKMAGIARHHVIARMRPPETDIEGVTIQEEPFETVVSDGRKMFEEHLFSIGEAPDSWLDTNIPLMREMAKNGAIQFVTARSNGRLFGYLMTVITATVEAPGKKVASNHMFFASPLFPGLGMKIQRASLAILRSKGVSDVYWGTRNDRGLGGRLSTIYRRLGATEFGSVFKLESA